MSQQFKSGNEFLPFHPQASHVTPDYRDGWNACLQAALDLKRENKRLVDLLNTPQLRDFSAAVTLEAVHQRERWGSSHDAGKAHEDWFWLLGYLGGKALSSAKSGDKDKALHHTISSAAALANWHAAILGGNIDMRPGVDPVEHGIPT